MKSFLNCPICGSLCLKNEAPGYIHTRVYPVLQGPFQSFFCYSPLANDPLHYYNHLVETKSNEIVHQEFSVNIGNRSVIFANDYSNGVSFVLSDSRVPPLEVPINLNIDFPKLELLKNKIRMALVFT